VIPVAYAPARKIFFDVHGTADKSAITLILQGTGNVPARGPSYAGWTSITSNGLTGPGPSLKIPKSDACTAQADIATRDTINDGGGPDPLSAQSTITLRCPAEGLDERLRGYEAHRAARSKVFAMSAEGAAVIDRLCRAMSDHDPDAMAECLHPDYKSEQPLHPERGFDGPEQVRKNWGLLFAEVPDLQADLVRSAAVGGEVWTEWSMHGTKTDGTPFDYRGMALWGVRGDRIAWARLYFEPVEAGGVGIDDAMRRLVSTKPSADQ
jgi:hypothetical protein